MCMTAIHSQRAPQAVTARDVELATLVHHSISVVDSAGRFGPRKVFISALWVTMLGLDAAAVSRLVGELGAFKRWLLGAQHLTRSDSERAPLVVLARADLVAAMDSTLVAESETLADGASYHFVLDPVSTSDAYAPHAASRRCLVQRGRVGSSRLTTATRQA
jgi:hypothetical protein